MLSIQGNEDNQPAMDEITLGQDGWCAKVRERASQQCSINRVKRFNLLNEKYDCANLQNPYESWIFMLHDEKELGSTQLCLCGHEIMKVYSVYNVDDPTIKICLGSACVNKIKQESNVTLKGYDICAICESDKSHAHKYCGGDVCIRCSHGARVYKHGTTKSGKPYYMWACTASRGEQCSPLWLKEEPLVLPRIHYGEGENWCDHGPRIKRSGTSSKGNAYKGLFCKNKVCDPVSNKN